MVLQKRRECMRHSQSSAFQQKTKSTVHSKKPAVLISLSLIPTRTDQVGCQQGHFPDHRPRPCRAVLRKGFDCIPRLPQARAVRMDSSGNSSRHPGLLSDLSSIYLGDTWIKTRQKSETIKTRGFYLPRVAPESARCKCFEVYERLDKQTTAGA